MTCKWLLLWRTAPRAMGCGASRAVAEPTVEEVVVDHERVRKTQEDQRLVVERWVVFQF